MNAHARRVLILALGFSAASCAHGGGGHAPGQSGPPVDAGTLALWRMDEPGGFNVRDEGPYRLVARAGSEVDTDFGRVRGTRIFKRSIDSFLYVPYNELLESGAELSVEMWIEPATVPSAELAPLVARWTIHANEQSWLFGIVGLNLGGLGGAPSPGVLVDLVRLGAPAHLVFAFQPTGASIPVAYFSNQEIELGRWTHVLVSYDGHEVVFYIDGRLDSQYALEGRIRPTPAPLLFGNYFDTRWITDYGDRPQVGSGADRNPYYAYEGKMDEVRISRVARSEPPANR